MTTQNILVEAIIPATGDMDQDHDIMVKLKPAVDELKKVVHGLKGTVSVRPQRKKSSGERVVEAVAAIAQPVAAVAQKPLVAPKAAE